MKKKPKTLTAHLGFLGAGNMAEALLRGLLAAKVTTPSRLHATDKFAKRLAILHKKYKIKSASSSLDLIRKAQVLLLAVKPQDVASVGAEINGNLTAKHLLISIAAGVPVKKLRQVFGDKVRIIRTMPNTPALIGSGATAIYLSPGTTRKDRQIARNIFESVGYATFVEKEADLDIVTGLSGSGPAYVFLFLEAMTDAAIQAGLDAKSAKALATQTVLGAAALAQASQEDLKELRRQVTSPGGTTIEGIKALEEGFFPQVIVKAIQAATKRSQELANQF